MTPSGRYVITNNIEATRIEQEEKPAAQGWEPRVAPWHTVNNAIAELTRGLKLGAIGAPARKPHARRDSRLAAAHSATVARPS